MCEGTGRPNSLAHRPMSMLEVDAVMCISIRTQATRRQRLMDDLKERDATFAKRLQFHLVDRDSDNPVRGCYTSHLSVWHHLEQLGARRALVLEDDASLVSSWATCKQAANQWLASSSEEWTFLMLGWMPFEAELTDTPHVVRVLAGALSHAYVINLQSPWLANVKARGYVGFPIDALIASRAWFASRGYKGICTFAVRPMGVIQRGDEVSNIVNRESLFQASWLMLSGQMHKLQGSDWAAMWLGHTFTRRLCEISCTRYNLLSFAQTASRCLVVLLLVCMAVIFWN